MILRHTPITERQFTFDPAGNRFVGEISSTHGFGRVYDDACDEGLTIVTLEGGEIVFVVERTDRNPDGEITGWTLRAAGRPGPRFPLPSKLLDLTLTLFND